MAKGDDGRVRQQGNYQQARYEDQQGPMVNAFAHNYGRGSESDFGNYTDIMNRYRSLADGGGAGGSGGGGGGGGGYSAFMVSPGRAGYSDPFKSYAGFEEFSKTGGYSREDIANMRARGVSPIRAAYANAEREIGRQRALQGGYSPNATASLVKMARERSQANADAVQNVEAGLAEARNKGRLAGLSGMSNIEGQRLNADVDISKFNTGLDYQGQEFNANAQARAQAANNAAGAAGAAANSANQFRALEGMRLLYGTTPGQAELFGNQLLQGVGQGGNFGLSLMGRQIEGSQLPGDWDYFRERSGDVANMAYPWLDYFDGQDEQ